MNSYRFVNFYPAGGHTDGEVYYYFLVYLPDNTIWNNSTGALAASVTRPNAAIAMTEVNGQGIYPIIIPTDLPDGKYDVVVCKQGGGTAAVTDDVQKTYVLKQGDVFGF